MRRPTRRLPSLGAASLVVAASATSFLVFGASTDHAAAQEAGASISDVGWWTSNPAASAPEGGLAVSAGPSGTISVGAVRVLLLVDRIDTARLSLAEEGGLQAGGAQLQVCATPNAWSAGPKQPMAAAPKAECEGGTAELKRSAEGVWSADVSSLLTPDGDDREVSLMVVPAGSGSVPVGFEVRFNPPAIEATGTSDDDASSSFDTSEFTSSDASAGAGSGAAAGTGSSGDTGSSSFGSSFSSPSAGLAPVAVPSFSSDQTAGTFETSPTASDTAAATALEPTTAEPSVLARTRPALTGGRPSRVGQGLFFVVVSLAVGAAVGFGHARLRPGSA